MTAEVAAIEGGEGERKTASGGLSKKCGLVEGIPYHDRHRARLLRNSVGVIGGSALQPFVIVIH